MDGQSVLSLHEFACMVVQTTELSQGFTALISSRIGVTPTHWNLRLAEKSLTLRGFEVKYMT